MLETNITKRCTDCKQFRALSEFHKDKNSKDNYRHICKTCISIRDKKYREKRRKYSYRYYHTEEGESIYKKYRLSARGKQVHKKSHQKYCENNPKKRKAKVAVNNAIRAGKILRPDSFCCQNCPEQARQYHHWLGYEPKNWFDIIPICRPCHCKIHMKNPNSALISIF